MKTKKETAKELVAAIKEAKETGVVEYSRDSASYWISESVKSLSHTVNCIEIFENELYTVTEAFASYTKSLLLDNEMSIENKTHHIERMFDILGCITDLSCCKNRIIDLDFGMRLLNKQ